jgi:hypothetical protein
MEFSPKSVVKKLCFCAAASLGSDIPNPLMITSFSLSSLCGRDIVHITVAGREVEFTPKFVITKLLCFCVCAAGLGLDVPTTYEPPLLVFLLFVVEVLSILAGRGVEFIPKSVAFCSSFLLHLFSGFNLHNWSNEWATVNSRCITRVGSGWLE